MRSEISGGFFKICSVKLKQNYSIINWFILLGMPEPSASSGTSLETLPALLPTLVNKSHVLKL